MDSLPTPTLPPYTIQNEDENWGYYHKTDPDPISMVIRVELFTRKPSETIQIYEHCMVTHERLCYRCLLSAGLVEN